MNLQEKTGLITGGTSGIGFASARQALKAGARKIIITGQNPERLEEAQTALSQFGDVSAIRWRADKPEDSAALAETVREQHGRLDFVFANAGVCWDTPMGSIDAEQVQQQLMINLTGPLVLIDSLVALMKEGGSIILTTSCLNQLGIPGYAAYSASKAGLRSLARTLSTELMEKGIRVNSIAPGPFETPIHTKYGVAGSELDAVKQHVASLVPLKRFGNTDEIVDAVVFLASDSSRYMRGEEITIDGGWTNL